MGLRTLDITILSATDLKKSSGMFCKMNTYAIVTILGECQTTSVDKHCGVNPKWNHLMRFNINEAAAMQNQITVVYTIKSTGGCLGDSCLGQVFVPVKDILLKKKPQCQSQSYSITTPSGRAKGVLKVSYKFGPLSSVNAEDNNPPEGYPPQPGAAYPPPEGYRTQQQSKNSTFIKKKVMVAGRDYWEGWRLQESSAAVESSQIMKAETKAAGGD